MMYDKPVMKTYIEEGQSRGNLLRGKLAFLLEGEGCFSLVKTQKNKNYPSSFNIAPRVRISMCNKPTMEWVRDAIYKITHKKYRLRECKGAKSNYYIYELAVMDQRGCLQLCEALIPHLIGKKRQAEIIVEFCKIRKARKHTGYNKSGTKTYGPREMSLVDEMREAMKASYTTPVEGAVETKRLAPHEGDAIVRAHSNVGYANA